MDGSEPDGIPDPLNPVVAAHTLKAKLTPLFCLLAAALLHPAHIPSLPFAARLCLSRGRRWLQQ